MLESFVESNPQLLRRNIGRIIQRAIYDFRNTWSTRVAVCGVTETVKRDILGHSSSTMTGIDNNSTPASQVAAMELVGTYGDRMLDKVVEN